MKNSLAGWNLLRKFLTLTGHFFTKYLLGIKYDATGAFRLYNLGTVPREAFDLVESSGYSFFFESLYVLNVNGFKIDEMPIILPSRIYGHSKMNVWEVFRSLKFLTRIYTRALFNRNRYLLKSASERHLVRGASNDSPCWDAYWESKDGAGGTLYDNIASFYRRFVIQANLRHFIGKNFNKGSSLLHAGCGGGQVDGKINREFVITAVDNSSSALAAYRRFNACVHSIVRADIRGLPFKNASFDGVYNLGVMEHFAEEEILRILTEFRRVLRPGGKLVIFWPPSFGASVVFLKLVRFFLSGIFKRKVVLHPEEPMLLRSKKQARGIFIKAGFRVVKEYFGPRDLFTQVVIVAEKVE
jgi:SAM-dependent methyltransferase